MPWVKVDDRIDENPKVAQLDNDAFALYICGLAYSNRNLTDGFIPNLVARGKLRYCENGTAAAIAQLESLGFWQPCTGGWKIHDFEQYQPSRERVIAEREATRIRVQNFRSSHRNGVTDSVTNSDVTPGVHGIPDSRFPIPDSRDPAPEPKSKASAGSAQTARGTRLANPFEAPCDWLEFAKRERPQFDPEIEAQKFADYWHGIPGAKGRKVDWPGTWRNFVRSDFYGKGQGSCRSKPRQSNAEYLDELLEKGLIHE